MAAGISVLMISIIIIFPSFIILITIVVSFIWATVEVLSCDGVVFGEEFRGVTVVHF